MTNPNSILFNVAAKQNAEWLSSIAYRWQDEKEYEDFADYEAVMRKMVPDGFEFVKAQKRPFGFWCKKDRDEFALVVKGRHVCVLSKVPK